MQSTEPSGGEHHVLRDRVPALAEELQQTGAFRDPARPRLVETRNAVVNQWMKIADALDIQREVVLSGDVRYFAQHLPPAMTYGESVAGQLKRHSERARMWQSLGPQTP